MTQKARAAATEYLDRYRNLEREIRRKEEELRHWREKQLVVTASYSVAPCRGGSIYGGKQAILGRIIEIENSLAADIARQAEMRAIIESAINSLSNDRERLTLQYRYMDGRRYEDIAGLLCCGLRQVYRIHGSALAKIKSESH